MNDTNLKIKTAVIIQARMTSTRLPGKVLMEIEGKSMLWHVVERLKFCRTISDIILAIPDSKENNALEGFAKSNDIKYFRGSEEDVLSRYYETAKKFKCDVVARITSDCPVIDPETADLVINEHLNSDYDYTSNTLERTFPRGLDVEVFNFKALERAYKDAKEAHQREHVTPYIYEHPEIFRLQSVRAEGIFKRPELRLTVDTKEDMALIKEIYKYLYNPDEIFGAGKIIELFSKKPELAEINADVRQKKNKTTGNDNGISLRKADFSDMEFLFKLRNQPGVCKKSINDRPVLREEHIKWLKSVISGENGNEVFIIESSRIPVGRASFKEDNLGQAKISISISEEFREKHFGTKALNLLMEEIKKKGTVKTLIANIKPKNEASIGLFEKLGFKLEEENKEDKEYEEYKGFLKYTLNLDKK